MSENISVSKAFTDKQVISILRSSPVVKKAQKEIELKQEKLEAGQRRLSFIQAKQEFMETVNAQIQEAEAELREAYEIIQRTKDKRASLIIQQISERANFDRQIGECEDFLRKNADSDILGEIERLEHQKAVLPSKLQCWETNDESIISSWPNPFRRKVRYGSNLQEIKGELKTLDCEIGDLKEQILSGQ